MATSSILAGHIATRQNCDSVSKKKKGRMDTRQETCSVLQHTGKEQIKTNVNDVLRENKFKAVFV